MNEHTVIARLDRLERKMKRLGAAALGFVVLGLGAMSWEGEGREVPAPAVQEPEVATGYHDNGTKAWEATIRNNRYDGLYAGWARTGLRTREGEYLAGEMHGSWRTWEAVGGTSSFLKRRGEYWKGVETGTWTVWHSGQQKASEGEYVGGERVGEWRFWNRDGSVDEQRTGFYEDGVRVK